MGKGVMKKPVGLVKPKPKPKTKGKIAKGKPFTEEDLREALGPYAEEYMPRKKKGKPAMKRPAKKEKETAKDEDETVEMLEGEEEEVVDEDEVVDPKKPKVTKEDPKKPKEDPKKTKLTKEALQDHNEFIRACKDGNLTKEQFDLALRSGDDKMVMRLWKAFEASRRASKDDDEYKETTKGDGGKDKKKVMLRSWCLDGGKCTKHYRQQIQSMKLTKQDTDKTKWLTQKQAMDMYGTDELRERVKAGTITMKKDSADPRFYKFQVVEESSKLKRTREWETNLDTKAQAKVEDVMLFENMMKDNLEVDDFKLIANEGEEHGKEGEDLLEELFGKKKKGQPSGSGTGNKPGGGINWDALSKVEETASQEAMERQVMKFKAEMVKEEGLHENLQVNLKDTSMEQKTKQQLTKATKDISKSIVNEKDKLAAFLKKKSFKVEAVKKILEEALVVLQNAKKHRVSTLKTMKKVLIEEPDE